MRTMFAFKRGSCSQKTRILNSETSVLSDMIDQCRGKREWGRMIYTRKHIPYKISHPQANNSSAIEKQTIEIPTPNGQTFTVSNWYLPPENSHYVQRTNNSLSELQPDTKEHVVICADVNAHYTAWNQTANPNTRGEYLANAAMDANSTFLNDPEQPTRQDLATGALSSPDVAIIHAAF